MKSVVLSSFVAIGSVVCAQPYIPEPQPVETDFDISALYYPGTEHMPEWNMVEQVTPEAKPLLGWYDESDPENIDWQIKWAVEHGISSFCVCWYWNRGVQRLDHWVKAFYKAKFRRYFKWYVMYANHNDPGAHSTADQIAVTKFWIDNYFKTPEYYRIDGKPVVVYCSSYLLDRDFINEAKLKGETLKPGEGIRRALDISEKLAKEAGLKGIYWIDMKWLRDPLEYTFNKKLYDRVPKSGFSAMMSYNLGGETPCGMAPEFRQPGDRPRWCDYALQIEAAKKLAQRADKLPVPFWPSVPTGYDDVSRAFQKSWTVHGFTTEKFRGICEYVKETCLKIGQKHVVVSPINEWQEGSYIEPNERDGFGPYDALRDTFCKKPATGWPKNLTPKDLGRPLKEYPPMFFSPVQSWTFDTTTEGWYRQPFGSYTTRCIDGCLHFVTTKPNNFQIRQRLVPFEASKYKSFKLRMKVAPNATYGIGALAARDGAKMRLKWGTVDNPIIGNRQSVRFDEQVASLPVIADGQWHEYAIDFGKYWDWYGQVNELWFEAMNASHVTVDIDWMRFE